MKSFEHTVDFEVVVVHVTESALLVTLTEDDDTKVWFPKSQIDRSSDITDESEAGDEGTLRVSEYIAIEKGLE